MVSVDVFFALLIYFLCYSGEKTLTNEWPAFLEIKGRVRLDAFEKFLQELPLSRSRAVMVLQVSFYCITKQVSCYILLSTKNERAFYPIFYALKLVTADTLVGLLSMVKTGVFLIASHESINNLFWAYGGGKYIYN